MHTMRILGRTGDTEVKWDPADAGSVRKAAEEFYAMRGLGMLAFNAKPGQTAEPMDVFDPDVEEIVLARQVTGG